VPVLQWIGPFFQDGLPTKVLPLSERDELKALSLLTKPYLTGLDAVEGALVTNLRHYKDHIALMVRNNQKFEADVATEEL
jgi:hypothetical protein